MFGLEKLYNTKNLYIGRLRNLNKESSDIYRYVFRGPFNQNGLKYFVILPSMKKVYVYFNDQKLIDFTEFTPFNSLFPDLKRVTLSQIENITKELHKGDDLESNKLVKRK